MDTIFVQIAAYRDAELIPTVLDCINNAKNPQNIRFCIGWQHAEDENIDAIRQIPFLNVLDVNYKESKGVCWMRNRIQGEYNGEKYALQLDSHHRFSYHWDETLIGMIKQLKSKGFKKPILSAYLPSYNPKNDPKDRLNEIWKLSYDRFIPEGPITLRPSHIKDWEKLTEPLPSRAISGHFIFSDGKWCTEVPYDHNLYFHGEEISLSVRSYTKGYDIFLPHKPVIWHYYTREGSTKHWDDCTAYDKLNKQSYLRVKTLVGTDGVDPNSIYFGKYGLGNQRTLQEFERFVGVEFKTRRMTESCIFEETPSFKIKSLTQHQNDLRYWFKYCIDIYRPDIPEDDYDFWCCVFKSKDNKDIFRRDLDRNEINYVMKSNPSDKFIHIWRDFYYIEMPYKWVIWPHSVSKDWNTKVIESTIPYA